MDQLIPSDRENLDRLLDEFKSMISFEEIASTYCQSGRNMFETQKRLNLQRAASRSLSLGSSLGSSSSSGNSYNGYQSDVPKYARKQQHRTYVGSYSGVNGKDYDRQLPSSSNAGAWVRKPMVLNSAKCDSVYDLEEDRNRNESSRREIEGFLFEMLGNGFSLDKAIINDILGQCGYDVEQTMDKLMNMSLPPTTNKSSELGKSHSNEVLCGDYPAASLPTRINNRRVDKSKEKRDLEKEILSSLFTAPERIVDEPVKIVPMRSRSIVKCPLSESLIDYQPIISRKDTNEKIEGNDYDLLRKAVSEYKTTMKEYYTAAAIAFGNQEYDKAQKLREEGDFYMKKSKEADDKSAKKLVERDDEEDLTFDLQDFEPETASRFLKVQLTSLSGISSFKYMKARVGNNDGKSKHLSRKRRILRLLQKEHIEWTEEDDGWTVVIQLSNIKPENLSFARK